MDDYTLRFGQKLVTMPWWWFHALLIWLGLLGLILFLFGQRLVRPMFAVIGIVAGAVAGTLLTQRFIPSAPPLPIAVASGLVFGFIGLLMWRIGMAMVFGVFTAMVVALAVLLALGKDAPPIHEPIIAAVDDARAAMGIEIAAPAPREGDAEHEEQEDEPARGDADLSAAAAEVGSIAQRGWDQSIAVTGEWWESLEGGVRWLVGVIPLAAGLLGAIFALAAPRLGSSVVTALLGTLLALPGVVAATRMLSPQTAEAMTGSTRALALGVVIATVIGALIQWALRPRRADK